MQAENATYRLNRRQMLTAKAESGDELPPECATTYDRSENESSASVETYVHDDGVANDNISDVRPDSSGNMFLGRSARVKHQTQRLICEKDCETISLKKERCDVWTIIIIILVTRCSILLLVK